MGERIRPSRTWATCARTASSSAPRSLPVTASTSATVGCAIAAAAASAPARGGREAPEPSVHQRLEGDRQTLSWLELERPGAQRAAQLERKEWVAAGQLVKPPQRGSRRQEARAGLDQTLHRAEAERGTRRRSTPVDGARSSSSGTGSPPAVRQATRTDPSLRRPSRRARSGAPARKARRATARRRRRPRTGRSPARRLSTPSRPSATLCWSGGSPQHRPDEQGDLEGTARACGQSLQTHPRARRAGHRALHTRSSPRPRPGARRTVLNPAPSGGGERRLPDRGLAGARPRPRSGALGAASAAPRKSSTCWSSSSLPTSSALTILTASLPQGVPRSARARRSVRPRWRPRPAVGIRPCPCRAR